MAYRTALARSLAAACLALAACAQPASDARPLPGGSVGPGGGDSPSGGGGADGAGGAGGAGSAVPPCAELAGPFGTAEDERLDPSHTWSGFVPGELEATEVRLDDYLACGDGGDVKALVIYIDALWCAVCRNVAGDLADRYASSWKDQGIEALSLIVEDSDGNPADLESAWQWRDTFGLHDMPVAIDPGYALADDHPDALPKVLVVDPRTMRIVARATGDVDLEPLLAQMVAGANQ